MFNLLISIALLFLAFFLWIVYTRAFGAEWVKMPIQARQKMLKMLALNKHDIFYDLGCGDGQLLLEAAPKVKQAVGIEIDPLRFLIAKVRTSKCKNVKIIYGNLFNCKLNDATKIAVFLSPEANAKLRNLLHRQLVASYKWPISGLKLIKYNATNRIYLQKACG